jgi:hypothetical protein
MSAFVALSLSRSRLTSFSLIALHSCSSFATEDDLSITTLSSSQMQAAASPQSAYALNPQNAGFVATHMYGSDNSSFGPIYHHHHHHNAHPHGNSPYKVPTATTAPNVYGSHYQGFYGQMARVDYIPR